MVLPALHCVKGVANTMQTLKILEKNEGNIDDASAMRGYSRHILQWNKNKTKSRKMTQWRLLLK